MKINKITSRYRNDFSADMECEHCGHVQKLKSGYDDTYYHLRVIPALLCGSCGKNREGKQSLSAITAEQARSIVNDADVTG